MCIERRCQGTSRSLAGDSRGAILVMSVFMAVFLVGALWYLVGIGDAAIYREKMQDGADAVAFAAAVYHARGMNIIAMLNLIMAAALAVLIALKIAEILAFTIAAIAAALAYFTGGSSAAIAAEALEIGTNLQTNVIPKVQKVVNTVLKACSESQRWVARITPWVASARAYAASTSYAPTVKGGFALSASMMPSDDRLGLPVQEDSFDNLCKRGGMMLGDLAFGWIPGLSLVEGLLGTLTQAFPGFFCGSSGGGGSTATDQKNAIAQQCGLAKKAYDEANKHNKGAKTFDEKKCESDAKDKLKSTGSGSFGSSSGMTSKKVYVMARNGDDHFQVYGLVMGDNAAMHQNADKRVEMAAWGKASVNQDALTASLEKVGFAEAEFYYDQTQSGKLDWSDYKDDAMWNLRWRARLRRFRAPAEIGLDKLGVALIGNSAVASAVKDLGSSWISGITTDIAGSANTVVVH